MEQKSFEILLQQTRDMVSQFQNVEQRPWGVEGAMIELSKQVGDLSKRIMVKEKYYLASRETQNEYVATTDSIADELFDIWFCIVRIADHYNIDLAETIDKTTKKELDSFTKGLIK